MRPNLFVKSSSLFLLILIFFMSCTKDFELDRLSTDQLSGQWAIPLIKSTVTLDDLINDTSGAISAGENGLITMVYETDNLVSMNGSARTSIPDNEKIVGESFNLPPVGFNLEGEVPVAFDFVFELLHEDHRVDTMYLKSGMYRIGISTNLNKDEASVYLTAENFIHAETGLPLQIELDLANPTSEELFVYADVDLSEYYIQFDNVTQNNTVYINGVVTFGSDNNPNLSPYYINLVNEFSSVEFSKFVGFVAENEEQFNDTVQISIFNSTEFGNITFGPGSVRLNFDVYNSLGLPISLGIERLTAMNSNHIHDSVAIDLTEDIIELNYPDLSQFNQYVHTTINTEFNEINEALAISPDILCLNMKAYVNRDFPPETINHFADNSDMKIDASLEIDLYANIAEFRIQDTLDFDPGSFEGIEQLEFMIDVVNGFPINAGVQIAFVDQEFRVLCELFDDGEENLIAAGAVGPAPDFRVVNPTSKKSFVMLDRQKLDHLKEAHKIMFTAVLSTQENQYIKIYDDYKMQLNLGAKIIANY